MKTKYEKRLMKSGLPPDMTSVRTPGSGVPEFTRVYREGMTKPEGEIKAGTIRDEYKGRFFSIATYLSRGLIGEAIQIGTAPTLMLKTSYAQPYLVLNPSQSIGLSASRTAINGVVLASSNTQANSIGVAGHQEVHVFINITAISGTWDIIAQSYDPVSLTWFDAQTLHAAVAAAGQYYHFMGSNGVATDLAFRFVQNIAATQMTLSVGVVLKGGVGGSTGGLAQTIFLGGEGVSVSAGYPLLEGEREIFLIGENVALYGVAATNLEIRVFKL